MTYYNVQKPFTKFEYQTGPRKEQNIGIVHTQNINPYMNAYFKFANFGSLGHYVDQASKNNTGSIGAAHIRGRFSTHANLTFSKINVEENGGIIDPYFVTDSSMSTTETGTRLNGGVNYMKDRQYFFDQKVGFVRSRKADTVKNGGYLFSIQYNYHHQKAIRIYEDDDIKYYNPVTDTSLFMYENNHSGSSTFDTSSVRIHQHLIRLNLEESLGNWLGFGAFAGFGKDYTTHTYYNKDTIFINSLNEKNQSTFTEGGIFRLKPSSLNFYGYTKFYLSGYRKNDILISGMVTIKAGKGLLSSEATIEAKSESKTADYFLTDYKSNHFRWRNNFEKENITEFKAKLHLPNLNTTIGARYALLTNHIYFNEKVLPEQFKSDFNVFDIYLHNRISAYGFNLVTKAYFQESGKQEVLPLPQWSFYNSLYYEHNILFPTTQGKMKLQLGVDWYYWTEFYAQTYSPATAQFHSQKSQLVGNYPFIGAFANLEIKRMRIYIKGEHINYAYMKDNNIANYFMSPNYPTARMVFKYGITWTFYD